MGFVAEVDSTGRIVGIISAALSAGAVVGPLIAGHLLEAYGPMSIRIFTLATIAIAAATYFAGKALSERVDLDLSTSPAGDGHISRL
jgi:MFS family permease